MENNVEFQKIKNGATIWLSNPSSGYLLKNFKSIYPCVHCSMIHYDQDMQTT